MFRFRFNPRDRLSHVGGVLQVGLEFLAVIFRQHVLRLFGPQKLRDQILDWDPFADQYQPPLEAQNAIYGLGRRDPFGGA